MALDKKLIHFKTWNNFISDNGVKGNYATPSSGTAGSGSALYGQIKETSIVFIQDVQKIWTHGQLYDCSSPDLSKFLTTEDLSTLNNFMNNSSVSKNGETLTVKINNSTQSLTNTWRNISDKIDGTSSTISASEKAVKTAYDLAASKTSNTGTVTSVTPGTGLTGANSDSAITTSGTINLKTASVAGTTGAEIGGIKVAKDNSNYSVTTNTSSISANVTSGKYYGVEIDKDDKAFVYVPWTDTNTTSFTITANANDDDVVVLSGTNGTNATTYTASHAKTFGNNTAPYTAKYTSGNSTTSISGYGASATIKIPQITVDEYGHVRAGADENVTITMPSAQTIPTLSGGSSAETGKYVSGVTVNGHEVNVTKGNLPTIPTTLKNPNSLSFGTKSYDGSTAQEITAADLGLDSALKFHGTSKTAITDGSTTQTVTLSDDSSHTAENGCVLFYGSKEFVWNGTKWEELGNEGDYKIKQTAVSSPSASGSTNAFIDTISQDTNGVIAVTKKNLAAATNSAIGGLKLYNAPKTTTVTTNSVTTTSGRYYAVELDKDNKAFVNVPWTDTDNNTTYSAGTGLSLNGTTFSHADTNTNISTDTSYGPSANVTQSAKNTATFAVPQITLDQFGHVKSVTERTITVTDTDTDTNTDTKNTTGTTEKASTKLFLAGATSQAANPQTYSNSKCYVGTDNCLYSNGSKVLTSYTDTTYDAGTGLSLSGTTFNHSNSVTAVTTAGLYKVKYDAEGHITGTSAITKADITGLGIPGSNTDTHYTTRLYAGASGTAANAAATNPYLKVTDDNTYRNQVQFAGAGTVSVASDANGKITITGTAHPASLPANGGNADTATSSSQWSNVGSEVLNSNFDNLGNYHGYYNKNSSTSISNNKATAGHIVSFKSGSCPFQISTGYKSSEGIYYRKNNTSGTTGWSAWNEFVTIDASGNFTSSVKDFTTTGKMTAASGFFDTSDERLKNFYDDVPVDFDKLKAIPKKYFTWKDDEKQEMQLGTSAQAIQEIYPELVNVDENGELSVAYNKLSVIALAAIDKLEDRVTMLENKIQMLLNKIN